MRDFHFSKARLINFSDAVFSIAMTLLILELTIPTTDSINKFGVLNVLGQLIPNFIGLLVSFFVIALYWVSHVRKFSFLPEEFGMGIVWLNLWLLLFVVLLPFTTALYVRAATVTGPFVVYCINIVFLGLFNYLMVRKVFSLRGELTDFEKLTYRKESWKALNAMFIWVLAGLLAFVAPWVSRFIFILIFVFDFFINRKYKKDLAALESE